MMMHDPSEKKEWVERWLSQGLCTCWQTCTCNRQVPKDYLIRDSHSDQWYGDTTVLRREPEDLSGSEETTHSEDEETSSEDQSLLPSPEIQKLILEVRGLTKSYQEKEGCAVHSDIQRDLSQLYSSSPSRGDFVLPRSDRKAFQQRPTVTETVGQSGDWALRQRCWKPVRLSDACVQTSAEALTAMHGSRRLVRGDGSSLTSYSDHFETLVFQDDEDGPEMDILTEDEEEVILSDEEGKEVLRKDTVVRQVDHRPYTVLASSEPRSWPGSSASNGITSSVITRREAEVNRALALLDISPPVLDFVDNDTPLTLVVTSRAPQNLAFKLRSSPLKFRASPSRGVLRPGESSTVRLTLPADPWTTAVLPLEDEEGNATVYLRVLAARLPPELDLLTFTPQQHEETWMTTPPRSIEIVSVRCVVPCKQRHLADTVRTIKKPLMAMARKIHYFQESLTDLLRESWTGLSQSLTSPEGPLVKVRSYLPTPQSAATSLALLLAWVFILYVVTQSGYLPEPVRAWIGSRVSVPDPEDHVDTVTEKLCRSLPLQQFFRTKPKGFPWLC